MSIKDVFRMMEIFYKWIVEVVANLIRVIDRAKIGALYGI